MKKKILALVISIALVMGLTVPGTWATADTEVPQTLSTEATDPAPETPVPQESTEATDPVTPETTQATEATEATQATEPEVTTQPTEETEPTVETTAPATEATTAPTEPEETQATTAPTEPQETEATDPTETTEETEPEETEETEPEETEPQVIWQTLTDKEQNLATVTGNIPEGVELVVTDYSMMSTFSMLSDENAPLAKLDITLYDADGNEWQPAEGEEVTVTLNAAELGLENGHPYIISHIHVDENGETTTNFEATPVDGELRFTLPNFSFILVFNPNLKIEDVEAFYPAAQKNGELNQSQNNHWGFIGVYYCNDKDVHILLGHNGADTSKLKTITLDGVVYSVGQNSPATPAKEHFNYEVVQNSSFSRVELTGDNGVVEMVQTYMNKKPCVGLLDVNLGQVSVGKDFTLSLETQAGGWNIDNMKINLELKYEITKLVGVGSDVENAGFAKSKKVDRGDYVIYWIQVQNTGSMPLSGMKVTDFLPKEVFVEGTIQMAIGDAAGKPGDWETFTEVMFEDFSSPGAFTRSLFIRAQVKSDLVVDPNKTYVNNVEMEGMGMPAVKDSAEFTVNAPDPGTLAISKTIHLKNPYDKVDTNREFDFTIEFIPSGSIQTEATYYISTNGESDNIPHTVSSGGKFTLKHTQTAYFRNFPAGSFTVTEAYYPDYTPTVDGEETREVKGKMTENGSVTVSFVNNLAMTTSTLRIEKSVGKAYENDALPENDSFNFKVEFNRGEIPEDEMPKEFHYSKSDGTEGDHLENGGTISLKADQYVTIFGIPVGVEYTVTEQFTEGDFNKDDYELDEQQTTGATGKIEENSTSIAHFHNIYKRHSQDLTITKKGAQTDIDPNQSFLFKVEGNGLTFDVVICGDGSKTIKDLPIGTYTVTEKISWSWRYSPGESDTQTVVLEVTDAVEGEYKGKEVTFNNTRDKDKWLDGNSVIKHNLFTGHVDHE